MSLMFKYPVLSVNEMMFWLRFTGWDKHMQNSGMPPHAFYGYPVPFERRIPHPLDDP